MSSLIPLETSPGRHLPASSSFSFFFFREVDFSGTRLRRRREAFDRHTLITQLTFVRSCFRVARRFLSVRARAWGTDCSGHGFSLGLPGVCRSTTRLLCYRICCCCCLARLGLRQNVHETRELLSLRTTHAGLGGATPRMKPPSLRRNMLQLWSEMFRRILFITVR